MHSFCRQSAIWTAERALESVRRLESQVESRSLACSSVLALAGQAREPCNELQHPQPQSASPRPTLRRAAPSPRSATTTTSLAAPLAPHLRGRASTRLLARFTAPSTTRCGKLRRHGRRRQPAHRLRLIGPLSSSTRPRASRGHLRCVLCYLLLTVHELTARLFHLCAEAGRAKRSRRDRPCDHCACSFPLCVHDDCTGRARGEPWTRSGRWS